MPINRNRPTSLRRCNLWSRYLILEDGTAFWEGLNIVTQVSSSFIPRSFDRVRQGDQPTAPVEPTDLRLYPDVRSFNSVIPNKFRDNHPKHKDILFIRLLHCASEEGLKIKESEDGEPENGEDAPIAGVVEGGW